MRLNMLRWAHPAGGRAIEWTVALCVLVALVTVSLPSFSSKTSNGKVAATAYELANNLQLTRAEAIRRGVPASLRSRSTGATFRSGWDIFPDANADGLPESPTDHRDGMLVMTQPQAPAAMVQRVVPDVSGKEPAYLPMAASGAEAITFNPRGMHASGPSYFRVCSAMSSGDKGRIVGIASDGQISVGADEVPC